MNAEAGVLQETKTQILELKIQVMSMKGYNITYILYY